MMQRVRILRQWLVAMLASVVVTFAALSPAVAAVPGDVIERPGADGAVTLHYPDRFEPVMDDFEDQAVVSLSKLRYRLGLDEIRDVDVWLVSRLDDYFEWNEVPGRAPEWAIGLSLVDRKTVLVRHGLGPDRQIVNIEQTFDHELAHVAIDVARQGNHVPRWFNEGFASWHAGEWTLERSEMVARAAASSTLIPLKKLDRTFPDHHQSTSLAYAQSHHFVNRMAEDYGEDVFGKILSRIRRGETFSVAFTMVTGDDFEAAELDWRTGLAANSSAISNLADGTIMFFGAGVLFLLAWAKRRRRSREKFERLDDHVEGWDYDPMRYRLPGYTHGRRAV